MARFRWSLSSYIDGRTPGKAPLLDMLNRCWESRCGGGHRRLPGLSIFAYEFFGERAVHGYQHQEMRRNPCALDPLHRRDQQPLTYSPYSAVLEIESRRR